MKPIFFQPWEIQKILDGTKSEKRVPITPQAKYCTAFLGHYLLLSDTPIEHRGDSITAMKADIIIPPFHVGDILFVCEPWRIQSARRSEPNIQIEFRAGGPMAAISFQGCKNQSHMRDSYDAFIRKWGTSSAWHSPVCMPYLAARFFLRVQQIRVERLQDIDDAGAEKEGLRYWDDVCQDETWHPTFYDPDSGGNPSEVDGFAKLWDEPIKADSLPIFRWDSNPWVIVLDFDTISKEEASILA